VVPLVADLNSGTSASWSQIAATREADAALRERIGSLLRGGLRTRWLERADTSETVNAVVAELQQAAPDALVERLRIAGFTLHPYASTDIAQSCATCMYFEMHRQFCALPELMLPVSPDWSCRLWRI